MHRNNVGNFAMGLYLLSAYPLYHWEYKMVRTISYLILKFGMYHPSFHQPPGVSSLLACEYVLLGFRGREMPNLCSLSSDFIKLSIHSKQRALFNSIIICKCLFVF